MIYLSLFLNLVTVLDLYLMLFNPFKNTTNRPKNSVIFSAVCSGAVATVGLILTENKNEDVHKLSMFIFLTMTIFNLVFAFVVMIAVTKRLSSTGISKDLKAQIRARYIEYVCIFVALSYPINNLLRPEYGFDKTAGGYQGGTTYATRWEIPVCGFGIIMAISRVRDPLIRMKLEELWLRITCRKD